MWLKKRCKKKRGYYWTSPQNQSRIASTSTMDAAGAHNWEVVKKYRKIDAAGIGGEIDVLYIDSAMSQFHGFG